MIDRVFVLGTGRCGTRTWAAACGHVTNWTVGHETGNRRIAGRLDYPTGHIEADNRLTWFLGSLDRQYDHGRTLYIHLRRDPQAVAQSLARGKITEHNILPAWHGRIVRTRQRGRASWGASARLYVATVADNIELFLRDKPHVLRAWIEDPHEPFDQMWETIGADGDRDAAHVELGRYYGAST